MKSRFFHFFGPDGSGKSTHVQLLMNHLKSHGFRVKKVWIRSPHTMAFLLSRLLVRLGLYRVAINQKGLVVKIPLVNRSPVARRIWVIIEIISVLPLILLRIYLPLWLGYILVAERYLVDTIVTVAYFINDEDFIKSRIAQLLLRFIPRDTILIYLDSEYDTILERRGYIADPKEFIEFQRINYSKLSQILGAHTIDTSNLDFKHTAERICSIIYPFNAYSNQQGNI